MYRELLGGGGSLSYRAERVLSSLLDEGPGDGLHLATMLAASWEGGAACAHPKDDLRRDKTTIPQDYPTAFTPEMLSCIEL